MTDVAYTTSVQFLSTPSVWRATTDFTPDSLDHDISIHALRVEGDA